MVVLHQFVMLNLDGNYCLTLFLHNITFYILRERYFINIIPVYLDIYSGEQRILTTTIRFLTPLPKVSLIWVIEARSAQFFCAPLLNLRRTLYFTHNTPLALYQGGVDPCQRRCIGYWTPRGLYAPPLFLPAGWINPSSARLGLYP